MAFTSHKSLGCSRGLGAELGVNDRRRVCTPPAVRATVHYARQSPSTVLLDELPKFVQLSTRSQTPLG
jgi:hypothetical protein